MGFKLWHEALVFVLTLSVLVTVPCCIIAFVGARMFNEIGNFPSRAEEIQLKVVWKALAAAIGGIAGMLMFFHLIY